MRSRLRFENKLAEFFEKRGYNCIRSAGSRGAVDIFAINAMHVRAIQIKTTKVLHTTSNLAVFKKAILELRKIPSPPNLTKELWVKPLRRSWIYLMIDDLPDDPKMLRKALAEGPWIEA